MRVTHWAFSATFAAVLVLASCGGNDGPSAPPVAVASVVVLGAPPQNVLLTGSTVQLAAEPRGAGGQVLTRAVSWLSSNVAIATVSPTGLVTGVGGGLVTVTASSEGISAAVVLSVRAPIPVPPTSATEPVTTSVFGGAVILTVPPAATTTTAQLTVTPSPAAPSNPRVISGTSFDFGPPGTQFTAPITLQLRYEPASVPAGKTQGLRIYRVEPNGDLSLIPSGSAQPLDARVSAAISHFSTFVVAATANPVSVIVVNGASQTVGIGEAVPTAPSVRVLDADARPVPFAAVTFSVITGGGSISGVTSLETDEQGVATLPGTWTLGMVSGLNTLGVAVEGLDFTTLIDAWATAPATQLTASGYSAVASSGISISNELRVQIRDAFFNRVAVGGAISAELVDGTGFLLGTTTVEAVGGEALFDDLRIGGAGFHRIRFTADGLAPDTTSSIHVIQFVDAVVLLTEPDGAASNSPFSQQPVLEVLDHAGLRVLPPYTVSASIFSGTGVLVGTDSVETVEGVATFTDLGIDGLGPHSIRFFVDAGTFGGKVAVSAVFDVGPVSPGVRLREGAAPASSRGSGFAPD